MQQQQSGGYMPVDSSGAQPQASPIPQPYAQQQQQQYIPPGQGQQYAPPGQQYVPPQPYYQHPAPYPQPIPGQTTVVMPLMGVQDCPAGGHHAIQEEFTPCGICLGVCFFPIGILCCLLMREHKCVKCNQLFGS